MYSDDDPLMLAVTLLGLSAAFIILIDSSSKTNSPQTILRFNGLKRLWASSQVEGMKLLAYYVDETAFLTYLIVNRAFQKLALDR